MSTLHSHLKKWGLDVEVASGYTTRGNSAFQPKGVMVHHTASNRNGGNMNSYSVVRDGRPGIPGPLCNFLLGRNGKIIIIALGRANHAGKGRYGPAGIPQDGGNRYTWGIEAENNGIGEPWSAAQLNAYYRLCAALLDWMGTNDVSRVMGHKEYAPNRKIDPNGINMSHFRENVRKALRAGPSTPRARLSRIKLFRSSPEAKNVKFRLRAGKYLVAKTITPYWGVSSERALRAYMKRHGLTSRKHALEKLGFYVIK